MIPRLKQRQLSSGGIAESESFGISDKDSAHIMTILRDTLYSDKILAVLREYASNAWDAHREAGKGDLPIKVKLPTTMDATLAIRDFGAGLSHEAVFNVYTKYGSSTKRDSDVSVGMLGIGSKSGFAYADSFTVTSWHGGTRRTYIAVLDASEKGVMNLVHEENCGDETGVEISLAVKVEDINEFKLKAQNLFQYFLPRPDINTEIPPLPASQVGLKNGLIFEEGREWVALMGCVPYRVNMTMVTSMPKLVDYYNTLNNLSGALFFDIGEVQVSASREELKYSDLTKKALVHKIVSLINEYIEHTIKILESSSFSSWDRRLRARIVARLGLKIPKTYKVYFEDHVRLPSDAKISIFRASTRYVSPAEIIHITPGAKFYFSFDTSKDLGGYEYPTNGGNYNYVFTRVDDKQKEDEARRELEKVINDLKIDGIKVEELSTLNWVDHNKPYKRNKQKKPSNPKHYRRRFVINPEASFCYPWSNNWDVTDVPPSDDDIYVILTEFGAGDFYTKYQEDASLMRSLELGPLPPVYGYKNTDRRPITPDKCKGTPFDTWHAQFPKTIALSKEHEALREHWRWVRSHTYDTVFIAKHDMRKLRAVIERLGATHPISLLFSRQLKAHKATENMDNTLKSAFSHLDRRMGEGFKTPAEIEIEKILTRYPILGISRVGLAAIWDDADDGPRLIDYVKFVDRVTLKDPFKTF
jgi:hypothetical protein